MVIFHSYVSLPQGTSWTAVWSTEIIAIYHCSKACFFPHVLSVCWGHSRDTCHQKWGQGGDDLIGDFQWHPQWLAMTSHRKQEKIISKTLKSQEWIQMWIDVFNPFHTLGVRIGKLMSSVAKVDIPALLRWMEITTEQSVWRVAVMHIYIHFIVHE